MLPNLSFFFAILTVSKLVIPYVNNLADSLDLDFFVSKPLATAINLLPFLYIEEAKEYFSLVRYPVLIPSTTMFL